MSNLMKLFGTLMAVLGLVLGVIVLAKPGLLEARGIQLDTAVILLAGGILSLGQGALIDALRGLRSRAVTDQLAVPVATSKPEVPAAAIEVAKTGLVRKPLVAAAAVTAVTAGTAAAVATVAEAAAKTTVEAKKVDPVQETISALEQAKADVIKSMGGMDAIGTTPADPVEPAVAEEGAAPEEGEDDLYVVEEKVIRGRPARILSDETVEAETDEGWMRFENLEHLNEYLDSMEDQAS